MKQNNRSHGIGIFRFSLNMGATLKALTHEFEELYAA